MSPPTCPWRRLQRSKGIEIWVQRVVCLLSPFPPPFTPGFDGLIHSWRLSFLLVLPPGPCVQLRNGLWLPKQITHLYVPDHRGSLKGGLVRINLRIYAKNTEEGNGGRYSSTPVDAAEMEPQKQLQPSHYLDLETGARKQKEIWTLAQFGYFHPRSRCVLARTGFLCVLCCSQPTEPSKSGGETAPFRKAAFAEDGSWARFQEKQSDWKNPVFFRLHS